MQSCSRNIKIFGLYVSHILKGGNVGQKIINNSMLLQRETFWVQIMSGFKAEVSYF